MEEYPRKMASGVQMEVPDQLLGHGLEVAMRQRKQTQPRCQDQHAFSALDQCHHPQSCFWRGIGHGFAPSSRFRRLYRPTLLDNDWSLFNIRFIAAVPLVVLFVVFIICQPAPTCSRSEE